jgi:hypothetical protein
MGYDMAKKPGRPKSDKPAKKRFSVSVEPEILKKIDMDKGPMSRSKFLLNKAGYGEK